MFIKLGDFYFNQDEIVTIKKIGAGARVYLKDRLTIEVPNVSDEDWEIFKKCFSVEKR